MTNIALAQLQRQIEAVRREAFAEGYAAAMQLVREFAARPPAGAAMIRTISPGVPLAPPGRRHDPGVPSDRQKAPRLPHGSNARLVAEVLLSIAPRAARPSEIRRLLLRDHGIVLAFTSIRHALGQLAARRAAEQVAESRTWRHTPEGAAADAADD
jgi:hypothetical protein